MRFSKGPYCSGENFSINALSSCWVGVLRVAMRERMSWDCLWKEVAETYFVAAHWDTGMNEIPDHSSQFSHSDFGVLHNLALFDLFVFESCLLCKWFRGILFRLSIQQKVRHY